jgi:hypothetical protein
MIRNPRYETASITRTVAALRYYLCSENTAAVVRCLANFTQSLIWRDKYASPKLVRRALRWIGPQATGGACKVGFSVCSPTGRDGAGDLLIIPFSRAFVHRKDN